MNVNQSHWATAELLNTSCYRGTPQDKLFTGFTYVDISDLGEVGTEVWQALMRKGIFNAINYAKLLYVEGKFKRFKTLRQASQQSRHISTDPSLHLVTGLSKMIHTIAAFLSAYQFWKFAQFILSITKGGVTLMLIKLETITSKKVIGSNCSAIMKVQSQLL